MGKSVGKNQSLFLNWRTVEEFWLIKMLFVNALVIALGLLQVISVNAAPSDDKTTTTPKPGPGPKSDPKCAEITESDCSLPVGHIIPSVAALHVKDIPNCGNLCSITKACSFFIWDRESSACSLYDDEAVQTCKRKGQPTKPSDCTKDPCKDFENQECDIDGNLIEHFKGIDTEQTCQKICAYIQGCEYIVYGNAKKDCEIRSAAGFKCRQIKGIKSATYTADCDRNEKWLKLLNSNMYDNYFLFFNSITCRLLDLVLLIFIK